MENKKNITVVCVKADPLGLFEEGKVYEMERCNDRWMSRIVGSWVGFDDAHFDEHFKMCDSEEVEPLSGMTLDEYQKRAMETCMETSDNMLYMLFGLCEEVGELHGKIAKALRKGWLEPMESGNLKPYYAVDQDGLDALIDGIKKECGDVAWMLAGVCKVMGWKLEDVCRLNLEKLADRKKRGVIDGKGDER